MIIAGLNVERDLADPEIMEVVGKILENFDPDRGIDENEAIFESQFAMFEHQHDQSRIRERRGMVKQVREGYFEEMEAAIAERDRLQAEIDRRRKNTENLMARMSKIAEENNDARKALNIEIEQEKKESEKVEFQLIQSKSEVERLQRAEAKFDDYFGSGQDDMKEIDAPMMREMEP